MGKKSQGGGQTQTSIQKADPWVGVQGNLAELYGAAGHNFRSGGSTTAGSNPDIDHSMNMIRGNPGAGFMNQARWTGENITNGNYAASNPVHTGQMLMDNPWAMGHALKNGDNPAAAGKFLNQGNPFLSQMVDAATRDVTEDFMTSIAPSLASQFSMAGRTGSGAHVNAFTGAAGGLAKRLGDITGNIRGQAYQFERGMQEQAFEAERQRQFNAFDQERSGQRSMWMQQPQLQLQAAQFAPMMQQGFLQQAQALQNSGLLQRDITQQNLDDPMKRLQGYSALLQGASGYGTTTSNQSGSSTQPYNKVTGAVGGGITGAMLGPMMGMTGPMGAILGAGLGLFG